MRIYVKRMHMYGRKYLSTCKDACEYRRIYPYRYIYIYKYIYTHIYTYMYVDVHLCKLIAANIYIYIYEYTYTQPSICVC